MKSLNLPRLLQLALFTLLLPCALVVRASTLNTYQINYNYTFAISDPSYGVATLSFDVVTNDGCSNCSLTDLVSATPTNFNFVVSGSGSSWDGSYTLSNSSGVSLTAFSLDASSLISYSSNTNWANDLIFDSVNQSPGAVATVYADSSGALIVQNSTSTCTPGPNVGCPPQPIVTSPVLTPYIGTVTLLSTVPLPSSALLFGSGLLGLVAMRRKGKAQNP